MLRIYYVTSGVIYEPNLSVDNDDEDEDDDRADNERPSLKRHTANDWIRNFYIFLKFSYAEIGLSSEDTMLMERLNYRELTIPPK